jgi:hypothetical protein
MMLSLTGDQVAAFNWAIEFLGGPVLWNEDELDEHLRDVGDERGLALLQRLHHSLTEVVVNLDDALNSAGGPHRPPTQETRRRGDSMDRHAAEALAVALDKVSQLQDEILPDLAGPAGVIDEIRRLLDEARAFADTGVLAQAQRMVDLAQRRHFPTLEGPSGVLELADEAFSVAYHGFGRAQRPAVE